MDNSSNSSINLNKAKNNQESRPRVPAGLRIGGAFTVLAVVLFIFGFIELIQNRWATPFPVTPGFLLILLAAAIFGAFGTTSKYEPGNKTQILALVSAVVLVILSRFTPHEALFWMDQFWLPLYGVLALLCGLFIRRSMLPKG